MPVLARPLPMFERVLLRKSVGELVANRQRCWHCGRTPLIGEDVHLYEVTSGTRLVCDLCRPLRKEPPARTVLMHSPERERAVRVRRGSPKASADGAFALRPPSGG
jgi:hypothetical protein